MAVKEREPLAEPREVAAYLRVPPHTLAQWRSRGKGPKYTKVGRHVRYSWRAVDAYLAEQERGPDGEAA